MLTDYTIDHIEIYAPMVKSLAYWHTQALGFTIVARKDIDTGQPGISSYVLESDGITLVLTATYPIGQIAPDPEISSFVDANFCGVKRLAFRVPSVKEIFEQCIEGGAVPMKYPFYREDTEGVLEEASIRLYDDSEIVFINREKYHGTFKPGYKMMAGGRQHGRPLLNAVDHIAAEVRINELEYWTGYLHNTIGTSVVQSIRSGEDNRTGMIMNINQSFDKQLTMVIAEPETYRHPSKVQRNIESFGPGIHHLAFSTDDMIGTIRALGEKNVEFISVPPSYFDLLRDNEDFREMDIDALQEQNILIDKEGDTYLLQKFIKPISDRPFFIYEVVQRVNGYNGFALKNINMLKKAEEQELMR